MFELLFTHPFWAYRTGSYSFASGWPVWLLIVLCVLGCVLIGLALWRRRAISAGRMFLLGSLQGLLLILILILVWRPVLHVERVRDRENALAVAIDASASMAHGEGERSRLQQAASALQQGPLTDLRRVFEVRLFSFAAETVPLPNLEAIPPPGAQTRIGDALLRVLQTAGNVPLAGVVLITDGAENGNSLNEEQLQEIASYGVPVHTVGVGPERNPNDLELTRVTLARTAPQGATVLAEISVRHNGAAKTQLKIYDRERLLAARALELGAEAEVSTYAIEFPAGEPGVRDLRFVIDPLSNERNVINNARHEVLTVPGTRKHVLYLDGEPRWEYKFLRRTLESERSLRLVSVVRTTPNKYYRQGVNSPDELADGLPRNPAEVFAYDAIIIGSLEAATLTPEQQRALRDFVDRRGGSILMLAGRDGLADGGWGGSALAETLPVRLPEARVKSFSLRASKPQLTVYGNESAITKLDPESKRNQNLWSTLPALADYQPLGRLKPGAIVLLDAVSGGKHSPLLAWQRFGRGATYVLATASTQRWQMRLPPEDQRHEMFWRQLVHALADHVPARTALTSERTVYDDERTLALEAQIYDERFEPVNDAQVELLLEPESGEPLMATMQPSGAADGRYVAAVDAPAPGLYRIDMTARKGGEDLGTALTHVRRNDGVVEHFNTQQNRAVLERIAQMTGGRYWKLDELSGLVAAIPFSKAGIVQRQTLDLWHVPMAFVLLLALKLTEWLLRLKWGRL